MTKRVEAGLPDVVFPKIYKNGPQIAVSRPILTGDGGKIDDRMCALLFQNTTRFNEITEMVPRGINPCSTDYTPIKLDTVRPPEYIMNPDYDKPLSRPWQDVIPMTVNPGSNDMNVQKVDSNSTLKMRVKPPTRTLEVNPGSDETFGFRVDPMATIKCVGKNMMGLPYRHSQLNPGTDELLNPKINPMQSILLVGKNAMGLPQRYILVNPGSDSTQVVSMNMLTEFEKDGKFKRRIKPLYSMQVNPGSSALELNVNSLPDELGINKRHLPQYSMSAHPCLGGYGWKLKTTSDIPGINNRHLPEHSLQVPCGLSEFQTVLVKNKADNRRINLRKPEASGYMISGSGGSNTGYMNVVEGPNCSPTCSTTR